VTPDPSSAAWGIDGMLVLAGMAGAGLLAAAFWLRRRRTPAAEEPARRAPSPASVGLGEDPIVAALMRRGDGPPT
jgi:uncharacterized iron-regulated membrane protein